MKQLKTIILPILLATLWISISEFLRNQILFPQLWIEHYQKLGLTFPSEPINGAVWGVWALLFATFIFILAKKFSFLHTSLLSWLAGFLFMWVVIGNLGVLPYKILFFAIPWSFIEVFGAVLIIKRMQVVS